MYPYAIGLDIGISSVGWAVIALDGKEQPCGIINMGSRIFDKAENPKTGASLAAPRREARGSRRRLRRHRHRNERIRTLIENMLISPEALAKLYEGELQDIYALRAKALDEPVSREEFAKILIHLSQRRGFRSNRKKAKDSEDGKIKEAVYANIQRMLACGYRTVGEMYFRDEEFAQHKRNKGGDYKATVTRAMVEEETRLIFAAQRALGCDFAGEEFEEAYLAIMLSQRSFDEGPGGSSIYGGNQIDAMIGKCTLFPEEQRAAKACYSFEYFTLLERINHIRLVSSKESIALDEKQRGEIIALAQKSENLNYSQIRKKLGIGEEYRFNTVKYGRDEPEKAEKNTKLAALKAYHEIRKALAKTENCSIDTLNREQLDAVGTILSKFKSEEKTAQLMREAGIPEEAVEALNVLGFSKFGHISLRACGLLIPELEKGVTYYDACIAIGKDPGAHGGKEKSMFLKPAKDDYADIKNPVVLRAVSQTVKVLNAIIRDRGESPVYINIELARELSKDFNEREKIRKDNEANHAENEKIIERIREDFKLQSPTGQDILKYRLYEEQQCKCAYSLAKIEADRLFEPGYCEIDHIVPYSVSFDDSRKNKVLVLTAENREKGNRLPLQYMSGQKRDDFIVYTKLNVKNFRKRELLLKESIDTEGFKERNLQDTKYISSYVANLIRDNLAFAPSVTGRKKRVTAVNGMVTAYMRKRWGIGKIRGNGDLHHAVDAVVIACTTDGMIQKVSKYSKYRECRYLETENGSTAYSAETGEVLTEFPQPWQLFRKELEYRLANDPKTAIASLKLPFYSDEDAPELKPLFVSRMPNHKVTGAAHKDTVRSAKAFDEGYTVSKTALTELKLKNGEIENYYKPQDDPILYEALKQRLAQYGGDGKKAFAEPFYKPKKDGSRGPLVNKVKLCEKASLAVLVQGGTGLADNDSMVRADIFYVEGEGYYAVPVYIADTVKGVLPNKAVVANKPSSQWKEMKDENFVFSLYPNDLIRVKNNKEIAFTRTQKESSLPTEIKEKSVMLYYRKLGISTGSITVITHDNAYTKPSLGIKTLVSIEKYTVDVLGNYTKVGKEKRMGFEGMKR